VSSPPSSTLRIRTRRVLARLWPTHAGSRLLGAFLSCPFPPWQRWLVRLYVRRVRPELADSEPSDPRLYPDLDALFTRPLRTGARPWPDADTLGAPVDGIFLGLAPLEGPETVLDVKGVRTGIGALLGAAWAELALPSGSPVFHFYLSPRHHHRVYLPAAGRLVHRRHLPGRLLSVAPSWLAAVPDLNARNEREILAFETAGGLLVLVLVAAFGVDDVETAFDPPGRRRAGRRVLAPLDPAQALPAGAEIACFHLGSTVFAIAPPGCSPTLLPSAPRPVRAGEPFASCRRDGSGREGGKEIGGRRPA
jgi:phosphatidylserine decarboxylase